MRCVEDVGVLIPDLAGGEGADIEAERVCERAEGRRRWGETVAVAEDQSDEGGWG